MDIPNAYHPAWLKIISGKSDYNFELLATKILIGRLRLLYAHKPDEATLKQCVNEMINFFTQNLDLEKAQRDLAEIIREGEVR